LPSLQLIKIVPGVVLTMSVVIGFGAALLWIALGVFLTENSKPETYGAVSGLFWSVFQVCNIVGTCIAPSCRGNRAGEIAASSFLSVLPDSVAVQVT
jgi:MFS family permease